MVALTPPVSDAAASAAERPLSAEREVPAAPRRALLALSGVALAGVALSLVLAAIPLGQPDPRNWMNAFYVLFARTEPLGLALVAVFSAVAALWIGRMSLPLRPALSLNPKPAVAVIAFAVLVICAAGTALVFHQYALTADENMADFQARIFLSGQVHQQLPAGWEPLLRLVMPTHAAYLPASHAWMSSYLPVYAAIRALFMSVGLEWFTNAVLAALSIFAIGSIARTIWPDDPWKPALAAALLGASPQFLVCAMTGYAMPAHLALNLLWLALYVRADARRFWVAPFVGVAALGLHQPFFHALFAAPFLLRLLLSRRWAAVAWYAAVYLVGLAGWYAWWHHFVPTHTAGSASAFALHARTLLVQTMNFLLLLGWVALPLPLLASFGFARWRSLSPFLRDCATSCILTFAFYIFVALDQGHGWGYRYVHGVLGCLVLVALAGYDRVAAQLGARAVAAFTIVGLSAAAAIQLPLRCAEAESFVRPYAAAAKAFREMDADVVVFDPRHAWYSNDLKRNDPLWATRPIIVSAFTLREREAAALRETFPRIRFVDQAELAQFGLATERVD